jgi:hypothetical protein
MTEKMRGFPKGEKFDFFPPEKPKNSDRGADIGTCR